MKSILKSNAAPRGSGGQNNRPHIVGQLNGLSYSTLGLFYVKGIPRLLAFLVASSIFIPLITQFCLYTAIVTENFMRIYLFFMYMTWVWSA